jgi:hypothetical protein
VTRRVVVVCEGQTEEAFIRLVLGPHLADTGIYLHGITLNTSPGHKGGALSYDRLRRAARNELANGKVLAVTTLIDLYQLDTGFPGFTAARAQTDLQARLQVLQTALHADIVAFSGCNPARFIPHIQPHEFEALLFSDVDALAAVEAGWSSAAAALREVRARAATPEDINQGHATKPSARLETLLRSPGYRKLRHGPIAAERVGLHRMALECPHFARWLALLRAL